MTKEDAIKVLSESIHDGSKVPWDKIVEAVHLSIEALSKPSLPSEMDEAAVAYANSIAQDGSKKVYCMDDFKAGVEWMVGQGYTTEETVYFERLCDETRIMVDFGPTGERGGFQPGDKVIVQIRKK